MIMSDAETQQLTTALTLILTHPIGFGIELGVDLWIDRLDDGRFRVARTYGTTQLRTATVFEDVTAAVAAYLGLCDVHTQPAPETP